jgi:hypothetical protein
MSLVYRSVTWFGTGNRSAVSEEQRCAQAQTSAFRSLCAAPCVPMPEKKGATSKWRTVDATRAAALGAYCLDGSLPGYWYQPPPVPLLSGRSTSWLVFFDGGAWCYDPKGCESRARGFKGSSNQSKDGFWAYSGYMDANPSINPTFSAFHRAHLHYWCATGC